LYFNAETRRTRRKARRRTSGKANTEVPSPCLTDKKSKPETAEEAEKRGLAPAIVGGAAMELGYGQAMRPTRGYQGGDVDLRGYYQNIRALEAKIEEAFPIVVSVATVDGGREGVLTEVARGLAAKMIVEGVARLATTEESQTLRKQQAEAKRAAELAAASKVRLAVLTRADLEQLKA
jgi:hypothetical protein